MEIFQALTDDVYRSKPKMNNQITIRQLNLMFTLEDDNNDDGNNIGENGGLFRKKRDNRKQLHKISRKNHISMSPLSVSYMT